MVLRIELLDGAHHRDEFDSGHDEFNEFLGRMVAKLQRRGFGRAYVVFAESGLDVIGFVTMLRIGCLAVDKRHQGKGIGQELLALSLRLALELAERVGLQAVVVDAKDTQAAESYRRLHFEPTMDDVLCLFLPLTILTKTRPGR